MSAESRAVQPVTPGSAVGSKGRLHSSAAAAKAVFAEAPGLMSLTITRGPWFCPVVLLFIWAASLSVLAGVLLIARQGSPSEAQQQLLAWEQACVLDVDPGTSAENTLGEGVLYRETTPGLGKHSAENELDAVQAITLADVVLTIGQPQWGCLDYGLHRGEAAIWLRLVFGDGQIEAFAPLAATAERLTPDTATLVFYCYASGADYPVWQVGSWHGFVSLDTYQDCRRTTTVTPPQSTP